jgi:hypothetical protein
MTTVPLAEARQNFSALVDEAIATTLAARPEGIDLADDADVVAGMHARGLPDAVCMATLDALIAVRRQPQ